MMAGPAVEVRQLVHTYGTRRALDGIDLDVESGVVYGLLGPNGGGKTTLFRILATLMPPSSGAARVLGFDVVRESAALRRRIGVVFQSPSLDPKLTVAENLLHHGHLYGLRGATLRRQRDEALDRLGIRDRAKDRVDTLSGGLARRVELAKGLMHEPDLLLLDEPSTGLDPRARRDLTDHLRALCDAKRVTVLLTTHIIEEAEQCHRLAILDAGRLVAEGGPDELKQEIGGDCLTLSARDPRSLAARITERFGHEPVVMDGQLRIEQADAHKLVAQYIEAFGREIDAVTVNKPTLEDVFIHRTGHRLEQNEEPSTKA